VHPIFFTALHELGVSPRIRGDDHDLCIERLVDILEHLDCIGSSTFLLGIEQDVPLIWDLAFDHVKECGAKQAGRRSTGPRQSQIRCKYRYHGGTDEPGMADLQISSRASKAFLVGPQP